MPRDLPLGNGSLLLTFDRNYQIRDIYYPHVGSENHSNGFPFRVGIRRAGGTGASLHQRAALRIAPHLEPRHRRPGRARLPGEAEGTRTGPANEALNTTQSDRGKSCRPSKSRHMRAASRSISRVKSRRPCPSRASRRGWPSSAVRTPPRASRSTSTPTPMSSRM